MYAGPYMMFTPALPRVPTAGTLNAAGLKNILAWGNAADPVGILAYGSPTTSMRAPMEGVPVISRLFVVVKLGVNGAPVENPVMPEKFQPSVRMPSALRLNFFPSLGRS